MVASLTLRSALRVAHLFTALRNSPPRLLSTTSTSSVLVYFERPVRPLLRAAGGRRKERVAVDPLAPLDSLTDHIAAKLNDGADAALLRARHGRRHLASNDELRAALRSVTPPTTVVVRVGAAPGAALPPPASDDLPAPPPGPLQMLSAFKFAQIDADRLEPLRDELAAALAALRVRGTVYLAPEGVNLQCAVAPADVGALRAALTAPPELRSLRLNLGETVEAEAAADDAPFKRLVVKTRPQVLTDGLPTPLDWTAAGEAVAPARWAEALAQPGAVVLDCRNVYESDAGAFEGAEPLGTATFAESWEVLRRRLDGVDKDTPVLTYCTGGIRCVKTNAYIKQQLGFTRTYRLEDGIIGYNRHLRDHPGEGSVWRGENFVFDRRRAEQGSDQ